MDAQRLAGLLADTPLRGKLHVVDVTDSTNDELRRLAAGRVDDGLVVVANEQTAGRGRLGRSWHSPRGLGIYVSTLFRPAEHASRVTRWTLGASVAACEACRELSACAVTIEWPNDLVVAGRKLAGILTEFRRSTGASSQLVIGAGFNVGHGPGDFPQELTRSATSLHLASGRSMLVDREELAALYLRKLLGVAEELRHDRWHGVARRWEALAPGARGQRVRVTTGGDSASAEGRTAGVDSSGALLVKLDDGATTAVRMVESVEPVEE